MRYQVRCINKQPRQSPWDRITHIGGDGWKHTEADAIYRIEARTDSYHVGSGTSEVEVVVAVREGVKYLKTRNDGGKPNNLLSLPECI